MATPPLLALPSQLWPVATTVAVLLGLCGALVGLVTGRLVYLFAAARPDTRSRGRAAVRAADTASPAPEASTDPALDEDEGPPPPRCPHCRAELRFARGLPADRGFRRRGRCPHCEQVVGTHPGVVATTAALYALTGALVVHHASWFPLGHLAVLWLVAVGVPLAVVDLRVMRLPNDLVAPAYPVAALLLTGAVLTAPGGPDLDAAFGGLVGMALVAALFWLLWRVNPRGMGFGDVKLSGLIGLYCGWAAGPMGALVAVFWAFTAFCLVVAVLLALRRVTRRDPFPLGPFLLAATLATVLAGQPLVSGW
ncbi:A24 family peptidase [Nocardiopsis sp. FIRDI 009]|uniref:prepilin peptidase n=1 Tax=Nocardiopsis sp. FIRDI 009 TaxID=714197 RepID=UPI000E252F4B|nr:A24 family peptidase [Nocardiopsis sp. FIRDI 009]